MLSGAVRLSRLRLQLGAAEERDALGGLPFVSGYGAAYPGAAVRDAGDRCNG
jgi:hypothetical protein